MTRFWLVALSIATLVGCGDAEEKIVAPLTAAEISGERLWTRITEETDYTTYGAFPEHDGYRQGQAPHGPLHRIFVNQTLLSTLPNESLEAPNGSIIVKENRLGDRTLTAYTVMAKVEGYSEDTHDWFWARYQPDGTVIAEGEVAGCIACHAGVRDNDYIVVYPLDLPPPNDE